MLFSSLPFLFYFLPITVALYYLLPRGLKCLVRRFSKKGNDGSAIEVGAQNLILLLASLLFYAWGEPIYIVLMIFSSVVDYTNGRMIEKFEGKRHMQRVFLVWSIIVNLSLLGFFKYANFFVQNINAIFGTDIGLLSLALPIGISFYTFQTMSYSIDVYRGEVKAAHNFVDFMCYVSMFPQLIAGPIVRYSLLAEELKSRKQTFDGFADGFKRFCLGMGKKVLIANNVGMLFDLISKESGLSASVAFLGLVAFALQIYFDFSGYSDMAIGLGRMFGFSYPENFNYPYTADSITDFWRRWHMSLSSWFRDYLYIPLGGSRVSKGRALLNIMIVWCVTGFWHGSAWNFVLWGLYFGVILIIEKTVLKKPLEAAPKWLKHVYALVLILFGWAIFAFDDMNALGTFMGELFFANGFWDVTAVYYLRNFAAPLIVAILLSLPIYKKLSARVEASENVGVKTAYYAVEAVVIVAIMAMSVMYLVDASYNPFLYFRF